MRKIATLCLIIMPLMMNAQMKVSGSDSKVLIKGTSTIHDWRCQVEKIEGTANVEMKEGSIAAIHAMDVTMDVKSIRSIEENGSYYETGMDKKVYEALKSDSYPQIQISLVKVDTVVDNKCTATVMLTIAGVSKQVTVQSEVSVEPDGSIRTQGIKAMKMTDFGVTPPKALFGAIKSGDAITIEYNVVFK